MDWEEAVLNLLQLDHVFKTQSKVKGDYEKVSYPQINTWTPC